MRSFLLHRCAAIAWWLVVAINRSYLFRSVSASVFHRSKFTTCSAPSSSNILQQLRCGSSITDDDASSLTPAFRPYLPHTLAIRDSIMIAHSFHNNPSFGPAGGLHGATYTVVVEFASQTLHPECNWVIDIGVASELVAEVLKKYNYKNLDDIFQSNVMTTTEFMCRMIFDGVVEMLKERNDSFQGWIKVSLWESHKAWASFEGPAQ
jgi:6-pyruvoyltetrahydropterin/6-carboxytetrahydropterin synthase